MARPTTQSIAPFLSSATSIRLSPSIAIGLVSRPNLNNRTRILSSIVGRDGVQLFVKSDKDVLPSPNP